jgi:AcrR family transcriptional regulator
MARVGLTTDGVVDAAAEFVDTNGLSALSLSALADRLGVKTPSLYNHVDGLPGLRMLLTLHGIDLLAESLRSATMGCEGSAAIRRLAAAYRDFALDHRGLYPLTQESHPDEPAYSEPSRRAIEPALAALSGFGLEGDDAIHATRALRSALHGFVSLESNAGFGIDLDPAVSFDLLVDLLVTALETW